MRRGGGEGGNGRERWRKGRIRKGRLAGRVLGRKEKVNRKEEVNGKGEMDRLRKYARKLTGRWSEAEQEEGKELNRKMVRS